MNDVTGKYAAFIFSLYAYISKMLFFCDRIVRKEVVMLEKKEKTKIFFLGFFSICSLFDRDSNRDLLFLGDLKSKKEKEISFFVCKTDINDITLGLDRFVGF